MARGFGARETSSKALKGLRSGLTDERRKAPSSSPIQAAFEKKVATMKSKPTAATVRKFINDNVDNPKFRKEMKSLGAFLIRMKEWQTDSGSVARGDLIKKFKELPDFIREKMEDDVSKLSVLWRGDDVIDGNTGSGDEGDSIKAFTTSPSMAEFFGSGLYTADDVVKAEGIINSDKVADVIGFDFTEKFNEVFEDEMMIDDIGDDEGERIVYGIKWKPGVGGEDWARETQPARYQKMLEMKQEADKKYFDEEVKNRGLNPNGTARWKAKDGSNVPRPTEDGYQLFDPVTKTRIRPPVELMLKKRLPYVFGKMTPEEEKTFEDLDRRG